MIIFVIMGRDEILKKKFKRRKQLKKYNNNHQNSQIALPDEIRQNKSLLKYWYNRYRLFEKFDQGIKLDKGEIDDIILLQGYFFLLCNLCKNQKKNI